MMSAPDHAVSIEEQIDQWRSYLRRRQSIQSVDVAALEDRLRAQVAALVTVPVSAIAALRADQLPAARPLLETA